MYKYTKIETVFKRDVEGTKKLIEGEYRDNPLNTSKIIYGLVQKKLMVQT